MGLRFFADQCVPTVVKTPTRIPLFYQTHVSASFSQNISF